jgi:hypothetical protein
MYMYNYKSVPGFVIVVKFIGTRFDNEVSYFEPGPQEHNWNILIW